jgi:hypothetical protein
VGNYYYAGRKRIELDVDPERIGVDGERAKSVGLKKALSCAADLGTEIAGNVYVVPRSALSQKDLAQLADAGALRNVYRVGKTMALPMPEVRVEFAKGRKAAALAAVKSAGVATKIDEESNERLVLRPNSGSGDDALMLANFIYENARPATASARMVQVMPRPGVKHG